MRPGAAGSPGLLSTVLARRPRLGNAPPGAAPSRLTAPLHGVPALVLRRLRTQRTPGFCLIKEQWKTFSSLKVTF